MSLRFWRVVEKQEQKSVSCKYILSQLPLQCILLYVFRPGEDILNRHNIRPRLDRQVSQLLQSNQLPNFIVVLISFQCTTLAERRCYNRCRQQDRQGNSSRQAKWNFSRGWDIWATAGWPRIWCIRETKRVGKRNSWGNSWAIICNKKHTSTRSDQEWSIQSWKREYTAC